MMTVDGRCGCARCEASTGDIYRMIGRCSNCQADPILMLFRAGDPAVRLTCPACKVREGVSPQRRATDEEFPEAELVHR